MQTASEKRHRVVRQNLSNRLSHWMVALSTFVLLFTGFGQMPMYKRYGIASLPGLGWSADFHLNLTIHYMAGAVLLFSATFHIVFMLASRDFDILPRRGDFKESLQIIGAMLKLTKAPDSHKYLAEQRLAYAYIAGNFAALIVTGLIKIYKNMPGVDMSQGTLLIVTDLHNVSAMLLMLGIAGHLVAFAFKENRALLTSMFSGCVDLDYVKERHAHWYSDLTCEPARFEEKLCFFKRRLARRRRSTEQEAVS